MTRASDDEGKGKGDDGERGRDRAAGVLQGVDDVYSFAAQVAGVTLLIMALRRNGHGDLEAKPVEPDDVLRTETAHEVRSALGCDVVAGIVDARHAA